MKTLIFKLSGLATLMICMVMTISLYAQDKTAKFSEIAIDKSFTSLEVGSVYKVFLQKGTSQMVRFESAEDITDRIWADVKGSTLTFGSKGIDPKKVNIYVTFVNIDRLEANGAATVVGMSPMTGDKFEIEASGASKVELQLDVKNLFSEITGAAEAKLTGKTDYLRTEVSGAATLKAWELTAAKANVEVSGAAQAKLNVTDEIKGETSGIGKINLKQNPKVKNIEKSGISHVYTGDSNTEEGVTTINLGNSKVMTIDDNGIVVESDSNSTEPVVINDDGVKVILKEKSKDGTKETKVLVINDDGVKVVKKHSKDDSHSDFFSKKKGGKFDGHWAGFELGVNGYVNKDGNMDLPKAYEFLDLKMEKSINVKINFFEQNINLIRNHFGLVTGLGLEYNNYRFANNVIIEKDNVNNVLSGFYDENPDRDYKKSKLVVNYLNLPVMLEYQTNNHNNINSFHLAAGINAGLKIGSHTKIVYESNKENKEKERDDYYLSPFKWDLTARAGWGILNLYANYSLTSLFKNNKGPELYPFSVGITLTDF